MSRSLLKSWLLALEIRFSHVYVLAAALFRARTNLLSNPALFHARHVDQLGWAAVVLIQKSHINYQPKWIRCGKPSGVEPYPCTVRPSQACEGELCQTPNSMKDSSFHVLVSRGACSSLLFSVRHKVKHMVERRPKASMSMDHPSTGSQ